MLVLTRYKYRLTFINTSNSLFYKSKQHFKFFKYSIFVFLIFKFVNICQKPFIGITAVKGANSGLKIQKRLDKGCKKYQEK